MGKKNNDFYGHICKLELEELAEKTGIHKVQISYMVNGMRPFNEDYLAKLIPHLNADENVVREFFKKTRERYLMAEERHTIKRKAKEAAKKKLLELKRQNENTL